MFRAELASVSKIKLHPRFLESFTKLRQPFEDDPVPYSEWIDNFGTHYLKQVHLGSSLTAECTISKVSNRFNESSAHQKFDKVYSEFSYLSLLRPQTRIPIEESFDDLTLRFFFDCHEWSK